MLFAFVCFLHGATWFHQVIDMNTCLLVFCSAAATAPREGKELLVQHLLVGEQDVRLLVDLEKNIITGGTSTSIHVDADIHFHINMETN